MMAILMIGILVGIAVLIILLLAVNEPDDTDGYDD